jgi:hypothetical protein
MRRAVQAALPYAVTVGVVALLLHRYDAASIAAELAAGRPLAVLGPAALACAISLLCIAAADAPLIARVLTPLPGRAVLAGKAGASLLMALNYGAGHGAYGLWLARRTGGAAATVAGLVLYIALADLTALGLTAAAAFWLFGDLLRQGALPLRGIATLLPAGLAVLALAGPHLGRYLRGNPDWLRAFVAVPAATYGRSLALRTVNLLAQFFCSWAAAAGFGLQVPLQPMLVHLPVIILVGALPLSVAGFGAVQAAWLLLAPWAPGERILAFQLVWNAAMTAGLVLRGVPVVSRVARDIAEGRRATG